MAKKKGRINVRVDLDVEHTAKVIAAHTGKSIARVVEEALVAQWRIRRTHGATRDPKVVPHRVAGEEA